MDIDVYDGLDISESLDRILPIQPLGTDFLDFPDHALSHRIFAHDSAAPVQSVVVDRTGKTVFNSIQITTGAGLNKILSSDNDGNATWSDSITPAGIDTSIQFNDGGVLGGEISLTFDKTTNILTGGIENDVFRIKSAGGTTTDPDGADGADFYIQGGNGNGAAGNGGNFSISGGSGIDGGGFDLLGGTGDLSSGNGGTVNLSGGIGNNGGDISLQAGPGNGGADGKIKFLNIVGNHYVELDAQQLTGNVKQEFPDQSGTFAMVSDFSGYVPYTGATGDVTLGAHGISANKVTLATGVYMEYNAGTSSIDFIIV